jgi:hypothetical protein
MPKTNKEFRPFTNRALRQKNKKTLDSIALYVEESKHMPNRAPKDTAEKIYRAQAWIGYYATRRLYGKYDFNSGTGMTLHPEVELAPNESIVNAFINFGEPEARRRLGIIDQDNNSQTSYKVGKFALREDEWSVLLIAIPTPGTASRIHREQSAIELLLGSPPMEEHEELIIGNFADMSTAEEAHGTMSAYNKTASHPMRVFAPLSLQRFTI